MSRYRPPRKAGSPYITPEGEAALRAELHNLWKVERPEVTKAVSAAAANGDRSENGDYIYGKKRLREIDSRVRFLRKRLDVLQVVAEPLGDPAKTWFGARVTVEDEAGKEHVWRIVGPDEFDVSRGTISCDSPLGRALLGKEIDTEVLLETPSGTQRWILVTVSYDPTTAR
ncbi:MAG: transcription elongation factor GreB [Luminiphilus sp.]|jgi:transcription elongation factor GreB|nr:transcription elongation factor GreB [Luminiphilus sp.]